MHQLDDVVLPEIVFVQMKPRQQLCGRQAPLDFAALPHDVDSGVRTHNLQQLMHTVNADA